jgi:hypothetical protein
VDEVGPGAEHAIEDCARAAQELAKEAEFYKDPSKMPAKLRAARGKRQQPSPRSSASSEPGAKRSKRVNARFDDELVALKQLWAPAGVAAAEPPATAPIKR